MVEIRHLRADGTLVLNESRNLPPGPVRVTVMVSSPAETDMDVIAVLHRIHAAGPRGYVPAVEKKLTPILPPCETRTRNACRASNVCKKGM